VNARKIELEPGCAIHTLNEAEASYVIEKIASFDIHPEDCMISQTAMPSIVLDNIPDTISAAELNSGFESFSPKSVQIFGGLTIRLNLKSAEDALKAVKVLETASIGGHTVKTRIESGHKGFSVSIFGFPSSANVEEVKKDVQDLVPGGSVSVHEGNAREIQLRYNVSPGVEFDMDGVKGAILSNLGDIVASVSEPEPLKRCTLHLKNVSKYSEAELRSLLCDTHGANSIQLRKRSKEASFSKAVAYFDSESTAFAALGKIR